MDTLIGIDVGTTNTKCELLDLDGQVLSAGTANYRVEMPAEGHAEQRAEVWWTAVCSAVRQALASAPEGYVVRGVGLAGQMHGLVLLDHDFNPTRTPIIWSDRRSVAQARIIDATVARLQLENSAKNSAASGFFGPSLLWVKENENDAYSRTRFAVLPKDYIRYRLCGEIGTDMSDASGTSVFDVASRKWSEPLLSALDIAPGILPVCANSTDISGTVGLSASAETGLLRGVPVCNGGGDLPTAALGVGAVEPGVVLINVGTAAQVFTCLSQPIHDRLMRTNTFCHVIPEKWYLMGAILNAGHVLSWVGSSVLSNVSPCDLSILAGQASPGANGLIFLPYLGGERTPHMNANARGVFFGLDYSHDARHIARAVLEGISFALRDCIDVMADMHLPVDRIVVTGGGTNGAVWMQILSEVLARSLTLHTGSEEGCRGAAILSGVAVGQFRDVSEALSRMVRPQNGVVNPDPRNVPVYDEGFRRFRALYKATSCLMDEWGTK